MFHVTLSIEWKETQHKLINIFICYMNFEFTNAYMVYTGKNNKCKTQFSPCPHTTAENA